MPPEHQRRSGEVPARSGLSFRSVFVSDVHLGSGGCHAERLSRFLEAVECENLFLVGDIVDLWVGARFGDWKQSHTDILRTILAKANAGTTVRYTPGNHDGLIRKLCGAELGNVLVDHRFVHVTASGRKLLVLHGDPYDRIVYLFRPIAWLGAWCYEILTVLGAWLPPLTGGAGGGIADRAKGRIKRILRYISNFEERITVDAWRRGFDGVVCGHVHAPELRTHETGTLYANTGDWVSHCTALVEHWDGSLELLHWEDLQERLAGFARASPDLSARSGNAGLQSVNDEEERQTTSPGAEP